MSVQWNRQVEGVIRSAAARGVAIGTYAVRDEAIRLILRTPKTGRWYSRRSVRHKASAPGEAPASDLGNLVKLIEARVATDTEELIGYVNSGADYAAHLEYGTKNMEARPYMRPALANKRQEIVAGIANEIRAVVQTIR